jgi:hypothetical protein
LAKKSTKTQGCSPIPIDRDQAFQLVLGKDDRDRPMPEWEYTTFDLSDLPIKILDVDVLNNAGGEGWELIAITVNNIAYMKRQIVTPAPRPPRRKAPTDSG